jgi:aryl-alcohol dehydrogenase-like predicted oxidoreductase
MPEELNASPVSPIPRRLLGGTGQSVTIFGLGGEGVLRTHGREAEAVALIHRALEQGVNYFETAPAYASSMDYYGLALGEHRSQVFLASRQQLAGRFYAAVACCVSLPYKQICSVATR